MDESATGAGPGRGFDPVAEDPPDGDPRYPATLTEVQIPSGADRMLGVLLGAAGAGPHPTLLLLHGFPGDERNFDLAHTVRRAGWNVLVFHYRGAWGSPGAFSFAHVLEDVAAALAFLRDPATAATYRADPARLVLVGHSMGGFAALVTAARDPAIPAVGAFTPINLGLLGAEVADLPWLEEVATANFAALMAPLAGTTAADLVREAITQAAAWDLRALAPALAGRTVLLVGAERDTDTPLDLHYTPLAAALAAAPGIALTTHVLAADHVFSERRVALARLLLAWLDGPA
ncbi:MAG TPA: alpha/beta fold hydrolase [Chloroflexia bacterium]